MGMDTIKNVFSKSRSASASSHQSSSIPKADHRKGKAPQRESVRDSGLGKSVLSAIGNGNHSRKPSGASSARSGDVASNGSMNG